MSSSSSAAVDLRLSAETRARRSTIADARARLARRFRALAQRGRRLDADASVLQLGGAPLSKSRDREPVYVHFKDGDTLQCGVSRRREAFKPFHWTLPPKETLDAAWDKRDRSKPHHWSRLCVSAFLVRKGLDHRGELAKLFQDKLVDGAQLFGCGKESVASLKQLETWGLDDGILADKLRTACIRERALAEGGADLEERRRVVEACGYDLDRARRPLGELASSGLSQAEQERRAVQRAVGKLKLVDGQTSLHPTFRGEAMAAVQSIVSADVATAGDLRRAAEARLRAGHPTSKFAKMSRRDGRRHARTGRGAAAAATWIHQRRASRGGGAAATRIYQRRTRRDDAAAATWIY